MSKDLGEHSRVQLLDLLRLVAVAAVIIYHYGFWGPKVQDVSQTALPSMAGFAQYGYLGVPVFFIISGFVIAYSARGRTAAGFAIARFSRIYPTFVACMTLTCLAILTFGAPNFYTGFIQWAANLLIAAPALKQDYMDPAYWSLVIEVVFYGWIAGLMAAGLFPRRIDAIILIWLGITFANELFFDLPLFQKLFMADDSGFFAVGLLIYEIYRGRRDVILYCISALAIGTAVFQALHKLERLDVHAGSHFNDWTVVAICLSSIAVIFGATRIRRLPLPATFVMAVGGLTYPLYLLHLQLGYVLYLRVGPPENAKIDVAAILLGIAILSWAIWRYVERPLQRLTKDSLTQFALQRGWPVSTDETAPTVAKPKAA